MASFHKDKYGWRIMFRDANGRQRTLRPGPGLNKSQVVTIADHVQQLVNAAVSSTTLAAATARWLADVSGAFYEKLATFCLVEPRGEVTSAPQAKLGPFVRSYIEGRSDVVDDTKEIWERAERNLLAFFGADKPLPAITEGDAIDFYQWLRKAKSKGGEGLEDSTARARCSHASQFFNQAKRKKLIDENPFAEKTVPKSNLCAKSYYFIPDADARAVLEELPGTQHPLLWGLSRWGGLRVPSEPRALKWTDIDWNHGRMTIHAKKTKRYRGHESRIVPIFPELLPLLEARLADADDGDVYVLPLLQIKGDDPDRRTDGGIAKTLRRAIKRAGVQAWPRLWQMGRHTRQTELTDQFPSHVVCRWLGNSEETAKDHYLRSYDHHFEAAAKWSTALVTPLTTKGGETAKNGVKRGETANARNSRENPRKTPEKQGKTAASFNCQRLGRDSNPR